LLLADRHERTDKAGQSSGDFLQLLIIWRLEPSGI
jgi:hypothetical protein